ncbi:7214_t:CDS:2, partial [Cetraspora pellucida]
TNSKITNNEFKKIKLSDKGSFTKPFFNFYEGPGAQPEDKTITKAKCVICHWISEEFYMHDLILDIIKISAYKTANDIVEFIELILKEFSLEENKILSITTDNESNVKAALSVEADLEIAHVLITKCKTLISLMGEKKK